MASSAPSPSSSSQQKPYACDTLPPPQNMQISRNGQPSPSPATYIEPAPVIPIIDSDLVSSAFDESNVEGETDNRDPAPLSSKQDQFIARPSHYGSPQARRLCVRHQRMADRGTNLKLQQVRILISTSLVPISTLYLVSGCNAVAGPGQRHVYLVNFQFFVTPTTRTHSRRPPSTLLFLPASESL